MSNKRTINIDIFNESITFIKETEHLKKALEKSLANQKLYLEKDEITIPANPKRNCKTLVSGKRSFEPLPVMQGKEKRCAYLILPRRQILVVG